MNAQMLYAIEALLAADTRTVAELEEAHQVLLRFEEGAVSVDEAGSRLASLCQSAAEKMAS